MWKYGSTRRMQRLYCGSGWGPAEHLQGHVGLNLFRIVFCSAAIALFLSFRLFDCSQPLYTPAVWHNVNPLLDHRVHFASLHTSQPLLDYLQSSAVVLELWGLQGENEGINGCLDKTSYILLWFISVKQKINDVNAAEVCGDSPNYCNMLVMHFLLHNILLMHYLI